MFRFNKPKSPADGKDKIIRMQTIIIVCLVLVNGYLGNALVSVPEEMEVYSPPDLSKGGTVGINVVPNHVAYAFAHNVMQQYLYCASDCKKEELEQVYKYGWFFTPECRAELETLAKNPRRQTENMNVVRQAAEADGASYDSSKAVELPNSTWIVYLDLVVRSYIAGKLIDEPVYRYPVKVVRADVNRNKNPWRLQVDCFHGDPERLQ